MKSLVTKPAARTELSAEQAADLLFAMLSTKLRLLVRDVRLDAGAVRTMDVRDAPDPDLLRLRPLPQKYANPSAGLQTYLEPDTRHGRYLCGELTTTPVERMHYTMPSRVSRSVTSAGSEPVARSSAGPPSSPPDRS